MFEAQDATTKMYLSDKLNAMKMRKNKNTKKYIHAFQSLLEQFSTMKALVNDENNVKSLMENMFTTYKSLLVAFRARPIVIVETFITYSLQQKTFMKIHSPSFDYMSTLFIGNKPTNKQKNTSSSNIQKEGDRLNSNATHTWKKKL